jgi:hypothetical protein
MFIKRFLLGLAGAALFVPQLSWAATSQQLLDRAVSLSATSRASQASTFDLTFSYNYRPVARGEQGGGIKVHMIVNSEVFPRATAVGDSDQRFRVESVEVTGASEFAALGGVMKWKDPASFEIKKIGQTYYVRIASLSDDLRGMIEGLEFPGLNLDMVVGRWLQLDLDRLQEGLQEMLPSSDEVNLSVSSQEDLTLQLMSIAQKPGALRAVRLESRMNRGGVMYSRIQFQINARVWTELETLLRKQIEKDLASLKLTNRKAYNTQYAAQTKELRTMMTKVRAKMASVRMIALLNEQTGMIERVEVAGKMTEPSYSQTYSGTRFVKRLAGYNDFSFTLISAMKTIPNRDVVAPSTFTTFESLLQMAKQQFELMMPLGEEEM